jgi:neurofibromin 1
MKAYIVDQVRLKDIDDVLYGQSADHIVIKHSQGQTITFITPSQLPQTHTLLARADTSDRDEISAEIRAARAQVRDEPSEERPLRPSDVPATLLNFALLNLASSDEMLRCSSLGLLAEINRFFRFPLNLQLGTVSGTFLICPVGGLGLIWLQACTCQRTQSCWLQN